MKILRAFLIAEIGINHNGNMDLADEMIRAAASAGADAVKFQNYCTEDFLSDDKLTYTYQNQGKEVTESQFAMFKRCELTEQQLLRLKGTCDSAGVMFFSTPTSAAGVDVLKRIGAAYLKNGSDYLGHLPLIRSMARSGIPTILSTGMATETEIAEAVEAFWGAGGTELVLLACTSAYPAPSNSVNLRRIPELSRRFGCHAGFSDHTSGWEAAVAAVCIGACMIEKHFTIDRSLPGPDQWFSADEAELTELVRRVREAESMLGMPDLKPSAIEERARGEYRLSCTAARDLPAGHVLLEMDIVFRRPASGLLPAESNVIIGKRTVCAINAGTPLTRQLFSL